MGLVFTCFHFIHVPSREQTGAFRGGVNWRSDDLFARVKIWIIQPLKGTEPCTRRTTYELIDPQRPAALRSAVCNVTSQWWVHVGLAVAPKCL